MRLRPKIATAVVMPILAVACSSNSSDTGGNGRNDAGVETPPSNALPEAGSSKSTGVPSGSSSSGAAGSSSSSGSSSGAAGASSGSSSSSDSGAATSSSSGSSSGDAGRRDASGSSSSSGGVGDGGVAMSAGCNKAPGIPSSEFNNGKPIAITAANLQRRYILSVPTNYDDTHPYKLVIAFHQRDGNDVQMFTNGYYHLQPLSNDSTIFVAPNGQLNGAPCTGTGNGETSCGWPNPNNTDFALSDAVVAQIEQNFCVDTNRIFATGWSFGGAMSYETSCERPLGGTNGYLRAVAIYSGSPQITAGPCPPTKQVAYYASHGTQDNVLPYSGGVTMAQDYAMTNGCTAATPTQVTSGNHVCTNFMGCATGYPVEFCSFNGPHTPDPLDPGQRTSWEYQNVWTFFSQF